MTIYRDACHCISRIMSIEARDGTKKSGWQQRYQAGGDDEPMAGVRGEELTAEERLAQDSIARRIVHRVLPPAQWYALMARYSINEREVEEAIRWLIPRVVTPAHHLFRTKAVTAWAIPLKPGAVGKKTSRRGLPADFYVVAHWDSDGIPERTLRNWRQGVNRWLEDQVSAGHKSVGVVLEEAGLLITEPA